MTIEFRVKRVERFIVTRHETFDRVTEPMAIGNVPGVGTYTKVPQTTQIDGEFDNYDTAYAVAYALARKEQEDLGLMPGDMGVIFPEMPKG